LNITKILGLILDHSQERRPTKPWSQRPDAKAFERARSTALNQALEARGLALHRAPNVGADEGVRVQPGPGEAGEAASPEVTPHRFMKLVRSTGGSR
jgi:hypothetical protein